MEQVISLNRSLLKSSQFILILALILFAPLIGNQFITGTIVNASLLISAIIFGLPGAIILCFIPSVVSVFTGLLPLVMAPMIPFIIAGNILLVSSFDILRKRSFLLGGAVGALLKFSFLFFTSQYVIHFFVKEAVASKIAVMMSWPQLVTALMGVAIVYILYNLRNNK